MRYLFVLVALAGCFAPEVVDNDPAPHCASVLPRSRNTNYDPSTPVKSGDLDDIEDCIIGHKHDELEIVLPSIAFLDWAATGAVWGGNYWTGAAAGTSFVAPVTGLFAGSRITRVQFAYQRGNAGGVVMSVFEYSPVGTGVVVRTTTDAVADSAFHVDELAAIDYTTLSGHFYLLSIQLPAAAGAPKLVGASVFVDRL